MPDTKPMSPERLADIDESVGEAHRDKWPAIPCRVFIATAVPELLAEVRRLSAELEVEVGEAKLLIEQQDRDLERMRARIAALEAGLREACAGWERQYVRDPQHGSPRPKIDRLRAIADDKVTG